MMRRLPVVPLAAMLALSGFLITAPAGGTIEAARPALVLKVTTTADESDSGIESVLRAAHARRGTDKWAGRVEAALRLIGRYVDAHSGSEVMVVERGEFTLLRMAVPSQGFQFLELGPDNLSSWATSAWQSRRRGKS
jgi:hypothetical protein